MTVGSPPIRSVLLPEITRIPGAEKREIQRRWSAHLQSIHLNLPFRYCVLSFAILSICSCTAFCRKFLMSRRTIYWQLLRLYIVFLQFYFHIEFSCFLHKITRWVILLYCTFVVCQACIHKKRKTTS